MTSTNTPPPPDQHEVTKWVSVAFLLMALALILLKLMV